MPWPKTGAIHYHAILGRKVAQLNGRLSGIFGMLEPPLLLEDAKKRYYLIQIR